MKKLFLSLLLIVLIITFAACGAGSSKFAWESAENAVSVTATDPTGSVLMDNDYCTVTVSKVVTSAQSTFGDYFAYQLTCENKSDKVIYFKASDLAVNGYCMSMDSSNNAASGADCTLLVWSYFPSFDSAVTKFEDFKSVEFTLYAYEGGENGDEVIIIDKGEEAPETFSQTANIVIYPQGGSPGQISYSDDRPAESVSTLIDDSNVTVIVKWFGLDEAIYGKFYGYTAILYIENKTDKTLAFNFEDIYIDGGKCTDTAPLGVLVVPGKHRTELWFDSFFYEEGKGTGITEASKLEFKLNVQDQSEEKEFGGYGDKTFTVNAQ